MHHQLDLAGVTTGVMTAFKPDGSLDWASMGRHIDFLKQTKIKALLVNAMMAEGLHLTRHERDAALKFVVENVDRKLPIIATIYGSGTADAASEAYDAARAGAQALLVFPHPAFGGLPLDPEIPTGYFRAIYERSGLPIIVFRLPAASAPSLGIDVIERLMKEEGILGIKDSVADASLYEGAGSSLLSPDAPVKMFIDNDFVMGEYAARGIYGAMSICAAVFPDEHVDVFSGANSARSSELVRRLRPFVEYVFKAPRRDFRARLKEALRIKGIFETSTVRAPLPDLTSIDRDEIASVIAGFKF